jgi:hypothetical protein
MNWFVSLFLKFSGDDYLLLDKCHLATRIRFAIIGSVIFFFFVVSTISIGFALSEIFHNKIIGFLLGAFIGLVFTNIYLLLLYTFNERILPAKKPSLFAISLSNIVRFTSLIFMIFIVGLPTEIYIHKEYLNNKIEIYKIDKIKKYENKTLVLYERMIHELRLRKEKMLYLNNQISGEQELFYNTLIRDKEEDLKEKLSIMVLRINQSNFFTKKILYYFIGSFTPYFILLCLFVFFIPIMLKLGNNVFRINDFLKLKTTVYKGMVDKSYTSFKVAYLNQLHFYSEDENIKMGIVKEWTEKFQDPPYNTILLPQLVPDTEQELINWLNNA